MLCQHCSTVYENDFGVDGFCCSGCREVYALIKCEGLEEFYQVQDRAARPIKDRSFSFVDEKVFRDAQCNLEAGHASVTASFSVDGITCMGCVWLIQRLSGKHPGVVYSEVSLSGRKLKLEWLSEAFNLGQLAWELQRFGYDLNVHPQKTEADWSSHGIRVVLCSVFTANAAILLAYQRYVEASQGIVYLLSLACLSFVFILGAIPFCFSFYRALQMRRLNASVLPVICIVGTMLLFSYLLSVGSIILPTAVLLFSLLITLLLIARYTLLRLEFNYF